ncbi:MAG: HAD hydrolase-like protein [Acidimicrobiia bacterium]|nr:HAD hydrolase-like protein [Acidimicrobiia bacterium]
MTDYEGDLDWHHFWGEYLDAYVDTLGVPDDLRVDVTEHLASEFASAALWTRVIEGSKEALADLAATGVRLGIISNADGSVGARLRDQEVLQVGAGMGVPVDCLIDSGEVGVQKPDVRIFRIALDAMGIEAHQAWYVGDMPGIDVVGARAAGLHPIVMDPFGLHGHADYATVGSLSELVSAAAG